MVSSARAHPLNPTAANPNTAIDLFSIIPTPPKRFCTVLPEGGTAAVSALSYQRAEPPLKLPKAASPADALTADRPPPSWDLALRRRVARLYSLSMPPEVHESASPDSQPDPRPDLLAPVTLRGSHVILLPLDRAHLAGLQAVVLDGDLHRLWYTAIPSPENMDREIERRLDLQHSGSMLPFTVVETRTNTIVGMTTLMNIDCTNRRLEIGSTFYAARVQRTPVNTEAKLLLLTHLFDTLGCIAVEFRTHFLNQASRRAIERLGARLDGILRNHMLTQNGTLRDTCVYSIVASEWPAVRVHLMWQGSRPR